MNILRLSGPADVAAALPSLLGFHPSHSLVVIAFRDERVVLTMRIDLPEVMTTGWAHDVLARTARAAPNAYVFVIADETFHEAPGIGDEVVAMLIASTELDVIDALMVGAGRWRSYLCRDGCCPTSGRAIESSSVDRIRAEMAVTGHVVATDRDSIRAEFACGPDPIDAERFSSFDVELRSRVEAVLARLEARLGVAFDDDELCFVMALRESAVRDAVLWLVASQSDAMNAVLLTNLATLMRRTPDPLVDGLAVLAAATAWLLGDGARGIDACERALDANPELALAQLLHAAMAAGLPPSLWRDGLLGIPLEECWNGAFCAR